MGEENVMPSDGVVKKHGPNDINTYIPSTTLTVEYVGYNDSAKVINALTQLLDHADLTHNQQRSVAEWVWMEYGRGGDQ